MGQYSVLLTLYVSIKQIFAVMSSHTDEDPPLDDTLVSWSSWNGSEEEVAREPTRTEKVAAWGAAWRKRQIKNRPDFLPSESLRVAVGRISLLHKNDKMAREEYDQRGV